MASRLTLRSSAALISLAAFLPQTAPWPVLHAWHLAPVQTAPLLSGTQSKASATASGCAAIGTRTAGEHKAGCAICAAFGQTRSAVPACAVSAERGATDLGTLVEAREACPPVVERAAAAARAPPIFLS